MALRRRQLETLCKQNIRLNVLIIWNAKMMRAYEFVYVIVNACAYNWSLLLLYLFQFISVVQKCRHWFSYINKIFIRLFNYEPILMTKVFLLLLRSCVCVCCVCVVKWKKISHNEWKKVKIFIACQFSCI